MPRDRERLKAGQGATGRGAAGGQCETRGLFFRVTSHTDSRVGWDKDWPLIDLQESLCIGVFI